jgi:hypothetical protein
MAGIAYETVVGEKSKAASPKPGENVKENITAKYIIVTGSRTEFRYSCSASQWSVL